MKTRKKPELPNDDPRFLAAVDLIGHTGALGFEIRYSDEQPVVWNALALFDAATNGGYAHFYSPKYTKHVQVRVAAGMSPMLAVMALCDLLIDGGFCTHCKRPSGFSQDFDQMPLDELICWYAWDPELKVFRRGCSGGMA